jgi:hypothetical protein
MTNNITNNGVGATAPTTAKPAPQPGTKYQVVRGDTLSEISLRAYGEVSLWKGIKAANPERVGPNELITAGDWLDIPNKDDAKQATIAVRAEEKAKAEAAAQAANGEKPSVIAKLGNRMTKWAQETREADHTAIAALEGDSFLGQVAGKVVENIADLGTGLVQLTGAALNGELAKGAKGLYDEAVEGVEQGKDFVEMHTAGQIVGTVITGVGAGTIKLGEAIKEAWDNDTSNSHAHFVGDVVSLALPVAALKAAKGIKTGAAATAVVDSTKAGQAAGSEVLALTGPSTVPAVVPAATTSVPLAGVVNPPAVIAVTSDGVALVGEGAGVSAAANVGTTGAAVVVGSAPEVVQAPLTSFLGRPSYPLANSPTTTVGLRGGVHVKGRWPEPRSLDFKANPTLQDAVFNRAQYAAIDDVAWPAFKKELERSLESAQALISKIHTRMLAETAENAKMVTSADIYLHTPSTAIAGSTTTAPTFHAELRGALERAFHNAAGEGPTYKVSVKSLSASAADQSSEFTVAWYK